MVAAPRERHGGCKFGGVGDRLQGSETVKDLPARYLAQRCTWRTGVTSHAVQGPDSSRPPSERRQPSGPGARALDRRTGITQMALAAVDIALWGRLN
jgi:hypothetical protein